MRRALLIAVLLSPVACKGGRVALEELVPDGATAVVGVDMKSLAASSIYRNVRGKLDAIPEAKTTLDTLRNDCALDVDKAESYVGGMDVLGQNFVFAARMPKLGTKEALTCALAQLPAQQSSMVTLGEDGGKLTLDVAGGTAKGWALDDDTLVLVSKGWADAVAARMRGDGKSAIDGNLKEAIALADRGRTIWLAAELPPLLAPQLDGSPIKGVQRVGAGIQVGDDFDMLLTGAFVDEAAASAAKDAVSAGFDAGKAAAVAQGIPQAAVDSVVLQQDGKNVRVAAKVPIAELIDLSTAAFTKYMLRSKTSEARVHLAKMFDAGAAAFSDEQVAAAGAVPGAVAAHACPNDGRANGNAGVTPPLSVDCSKGCTPGVDYEQKLWSDNPVWKGLAFQLEQRHYFHYDFRWTNTAGVYGACQFTAQAFGDLDGDKTYSTFERAAAADEMGVNAAAGLYIDQEVE
ncbi:MAG: hypothetical protein IAG13_20945 [Deltaproteobacteria bacterium]|nr:hypothetical protein [Nannocystaceae bacterium]